MKTHRPRQSTNQAQVRGPVSMPQESSRALSMESVLGNQQKQCLMKEAQSSPAGRNVATNKEGAELAKTSGQMTQVAEIANDAMGGDSSMSDTFGSMGAALGLVECMASGDNLAESNGGNFFSCLAKTGIDQIPVTGKGASPLALVGIANDHMDVDNPAKLFTEFTSAVDPYSNTATAVKSLVDTTDVLTSSGSEKMRKAESLEGRNREGKNTVVAQGLQALTDLATGDTETYVDNKAERGDRGTLPALGNCIGDGLAGRDGPMDGRGHWSSSPPRKVDGSVSGLIADGLFSLFHGKYDD